MSDLIDRRSAMDAIADLYWMDERLLNFKREINAVYDKILNLPSAQPEQKNERWIPCTEQLPEVFQWVLVSTDYDVDRMYLTSGGYWSDGVGNLEAPGYALAWMPLPKRWEGKT